jgi:hypothetical protein
MDRLIVAGLRFGKRHPPGAEVSLVRAGQACPVIMMLFEGRCTIRRRRASWRACCPRRVS